MLGDCGYLPKFSYLAKFPTNNDKGVLYQIKRVT